MSINLF